MGSKTMNYQLNQWEADDSFLRTDFNEDNAKIDAALKAHDTALGQKADSSSVTASLNALNTTVSAKCQVVFGSYTGDGTASRTIALGFRPKGVFLVEKGGWMDVNGDSYGGLAADGMDAKALAVADTGFTVYCNFSGALYTNVTNTVYHYAAFR